jgi:4-hydroxy-tetrahydrodipicolinate synthase
MADQLKTGRTNLKGLFPACVTPFDEDGTIDWKGLNRHHAETLGADGVRGILVNGHLGEVLTLTDEERWGVVRSAIKERRDGQLIVAGVDGHQVREVARKATAAAEAGADAVLVLPPFDVMPYRGAARDAEAAAEYFERLVELADVDIVLFQYSAATGCSYPPDVLQALSQLPNIVGVKLGADSVTEYTKAVARLSPPTAALAACDTADLLGMLLCGADGAMIGIAVIGPASWSELVQAVEANEAERARVLFNSTCRPIIEGVFSRQKNRPAESEVAAVKEALALLGQIDSAYVRLPNVGIGPQGRHTVLQGLVQAGLLNANDHEIGG